MVGGFPRKGGMERKDVMAKNVAIYKGQAAALESGAKPDVKVITPVACLSAPSASCGFHSVEHSEYRCVCSMQLPLTPKGAKGEIMTPLPALPLHHTSGVVLLPQGGCRYLHTSMFASVLALTPSHYREM